ncbi:O-methyltransferase family protein [Viridothelium virens]|uniref:O-methyltransferase family protein n=1 Tax=Viridothelium virens TaxID=1048519 RepID=A0A6A6HA30_VIRVR|nr:O-methyltransferase family protein [Viridothelium virens]
MGSLQQAIRAVENAALAQDNGEEGAHGRLLDAIDNLTSLTSTPTDMVARIRRQAMPLAILRIVIEMGLLDALNETPDKAVTTEALGQKTEINELLILRLMRCIAGIGAVDEVGENTFAANQATRYVLQPGSTAALRFQHDIFYGMFNALVPYLQKHQTIHQFPEKSGEETVFQYAFGNTFFEYIKSNQAWKRNFDNFMSYRHSSTTWYETYPVEKELEIDNLKQDPQSVLLVDVAGGSGHDALTFRERFPGLPGRCILEDLPETLQRVDQIERPGIELVPYDFYTPQPIKGARVYFFRRILHDWSDDQCRKFLVNTVAAMDAGYSRILIEDRILPSSGVNLSTALADVNIMMVAAGIERTETQFRQLLHSVGLEVVKVWYSSGSVIEGVIEARRRGPSKHD